MILNFDQGRTGKHLNRSKIIHLDDCGLGSLRSHKIEIYWCTMQRDIRNLLIAQIVLTCLVAFGYLVAIPSLEAVPYAIAAFYGGSLLMFNTGLMFLKLRKTGNMDADENSMNIQLAIYGGFVKRFIIAIVGFAIGIVVLKLPPGPIVVAFGVSYFSFVIAAKLHAKALRK